MKKLILKLKIKILSYILTGDVKYTIKCALETQKTFLTHRISYVRDFNGIESDSIELQSVSAMYDLLDCDDEDVYSHAMRNIDSYEKYLF